MKSKDIFVRVLKKGYRLIMNKKFENPTCDIDRQSVNKKIYDLLTSDQPCMISRLGTTELIAINNYLCISSSEKNYIKIRNYITDKTHLPWWDENHLKYMENFSGIFPPTISTAERFAQRYLIDIPKIDLLGSFQYYEKYMPLKENVQLVHLETLYPFFVSTPWTKALKGKKVLIVHPFEDTIQYQYKNRANLFENVDIIPEFELITLRAIQSAASTEVPFQDWFEALTFMENQIKEIDFDICILGCGAYGLPLAAFIKDMGKKAFHIGGGLQLLFGIKGKRWDDPNYGFTEFKNHKGLMGQSYASLYNDFWIKPLLIDTPQMASRVDGATYW
jgi:hypothetical protein